MMTNTEIKKIKLYHILHYDKLPLIQRTGGLICDSEVKKRTLSGTTIGMGSIKQRRMDELILNSHPSLYVGDCVPFYFCSRSIMLFIIHKNNHESLTYSGGQKPIVHLVFNMSKVINWANRTGRKWAFTTSNAGSRYFSDYSDLIDIDQLNWDAIRARNWQECKEDKQAEFLVEMEVPWELVEEIVVYSDYYLNTVESILSNHEYRPRIRVDRSWYY